MIAVDTNILVYAHRQEYSWHPRAATCLMELAEGRGMWGLPWNCVHEFLSTVTNPKVFKTPTPVESALNQMETLLKVPNLHVLRETEEHWTVLRRLLKAADVRGGKVHDARVAAICIQHGVREFWTADRDFSSFPTLRVRNPLIVS